MTIEEMIEIADEYTGEEREIAIECLQNTIEVLDRVLIKLEDK